MKPLILIDLDHTLVDTSKLKFEFPHLSDARNHLASLPSSGFDPYLYPDTISFIHYLLNYATPAIFSEGPLEFQHHKIQKSALCQLISPEYLFIFPSESKLNHLDQLLSTHTISALVDDKPEVIDAANSAHLKSIRLNRGIHQDIPSVSPATHTVSTLTDIIQNNLLASL